MTVVFHHAEDRKRQPQLPQDAHSHIGVVYAAINKQKVRGITEALVPCLVVSQSPEKNLVHGGVVILPGQVLDLEALILTLFGLAVLEDHHTGHNVRTGDVGNIIGFHSGGRGNGQHLP